MLRPWIFTRSTSKNAVAETLFKRHSLFISLFQGFLIGAAFSFRGLGRIADSWRARPPFPNDNAYADAILEYRDRTLRPDWKLAQDQRTAAG
jgi:hypothetical protein